LADGALLLLLLDDANVGSSHWFGLNETSLTTEG